MMRVLMMLAAFSLCVSITVSNITLDTRSILLKEWQNTIIIVLLIFFSIYQEYGKTE